MNKLNARWNCTTRFVTTYTIMGALIESHIFCEAVRIDKGQKHDTQHVGSSSTLETEVDVVIYDT